MTVFAAGNNLEDTSGDHPEVRVHSEAFPDAYIITELNDSVIFPVSEENLYNLGLVKATVFIEEEYALINDEVTIVSSRLLSEEEVMAIGVENFECYQIPSREELLARSAYESRGKLTIELNAYYEYYGDNGDNGVKCFVTGTGKWLTLGLSTSSEYPAVGEDFIGVTWGGDFQATRADGHVDWNISLSDLPDITLARAFPNSGRVWSFFEYWASYNGPQRAYVKKVTASLTLDKANMDGGGNKTEVCLQYIHTYQDVQVSVSGNDEGGMGFTVTGTDKQWTISCVMNGLPY